MALITKARTKNDPHVPAYGLWSLVLINSAIFIFFAFTFFKPQTNRDWRSSFGAFLVALFTEMYGFPLTIYLLSGWLQSKYPNVDWFSHDAGHLLEMLFGWRAARSASPSGNSATHTVPTRPKCPALSRVFGSANRTSRRMTVRTDAPFGGNPRRKDACNILRPYRP